MSKVRIVRGIKTPECRDCKQYRPIEGKTDIGNCFGLPPVLVKMQTAVGEQLVMLTTEVRPNREQCFLPAIVKLIAPKPVAHLTVKR
jgi:hypothetical protein